MAITRSAPSRPAWPRRAAPDGAVVAVVAADRALDALYRRACAGPPDGDGVVDAIAAFEATLVTPGSRFDLFLQGSASGPAAIPACGTDRGSGHPDPTRGSRRPGLWRVEGGALAFPAGPRTGTLPAR
jgi:hypothetical protein